MHTVAFCEPAILTVRRSSQGTGPESLASMTSETSPSHTQTCGVPDSLARTSLRPAAASGYAANVAAYGRPSVASLGSYDLATRSWRTFQRCFIEDWERYSETWPRSGMTRSGTAYQLPPLVPLTEETESGLWPTPTVKGNQHNRRGLTSKSGDGLATAVRWATPTARDWRSEKRAPGKREKRMQESRGIFAAVSGQWAVEPNVGRMAHGVPARVDRIKALGNSLVPQIAEAFGRAIMKDAA